MSQTLIGQYLAELDRLRQVSGRRRKSVLREAFKDLLRARLGSRSAIDLLARVATVSVQTLQVVQAVKEGPR